ncbi:MAG TPA: hypothetical protein VMG31_08810 [Verrucomicrobiae bacterium]|nr:hypothetical protein [Verrucomicrobiae bacterium]
MSKQNDIVYQPSCMLAHDLINRLSIIVGYCDLLAEESKEKAEPACRERIHLIREVAQAAAAELGKHQCKLESIMRESVTAQAQVSRRT